MSDDDQIVEEYVPRPPFQACPDCGAEADGYVIWDDLAGWRCTHCSSLIDPARARA